MIRNMQMLKILGTICLIFINIIALSSSVKDVESLSSECIEPLEYSLDITINADDDYFNFKSAALINVTCTLPKMILYFGDCKIMEPMVSSFIEDESTSFDSPRRSFSEKEQRPTYEVVKNNLQTDAEGLHVIETRINVSPEKYWINSTSICTLKDVAEILTIDTNNNNGDKRWLVFTRIPNKWLFPHWINPEKQVVFNITIKYDNNDIYTALSHMSVNGTTTNRNNMHIDHFHTTPTMSTHLLALALLSNDLSPTYVNKFYAIWCRSEIVNDIQHAKSIIQSVTDHICSKESEDLSCIKTRYIIHHNQKYENAITAGLVFLKESDIIYNSQSVPTKKRDVTLLVARSVIQEMFSNWMATYRQSDLWFTEGLSTYYGTSQFLKKNGNGWAMDVYIIQKRSQFFDCIDTINYFSSYYPQSVNVNEIYENSLSHLWKAKVFSVFSMVDSHFKSFFENSVADLIFEEAKNIYYNTDGYINNKQPTLDNIWNKFIADQVEKERKMMLNSWITHEGYPIMKVTRNFAANSVTIKIECILVTNVTHNEVCHKWWIPLHYVPFRGKDRQQGSHSVLEPKKRDYTLENFGNDAFLIIVDTTGFRVSYDYQSWKNIIEFAKDPGFRSNNDINDISRAQLLDDALYFLIKYPEKKISTDTNNNYITNNNNKSDYDDLTIFFDLASTLLDNESYLEWYPMFSALEHVSTKIFPHDTDIKNKFAVILDKANDVMKKAQDLNFENNFENTIINQLRHEAVKWICLLDDKMCKSYIDAIVQWHLTDPEKNKLLPNWQKWIYCQALKLENDASESSVWEVILKNKEYTILQLEEFMSCSGKPDNVIKSLEFLARDRLLQRSLEAMLNGDFDTFLNILKKHCNDAQLLKIKLNELQRIKPRGVQIHSVLTVIINDIHSEEALEEVKIYVENLKDTEIKYVVDPLLRKIRQRQTNIRLKKHNIRFRQRDILASNNINE